MDFQEVKKEIFALHHIGEALGNYENNWVNFKNEEGFKLVYKLDSEQREAYEQIYVDGIACSWEVKNLLVTINTDLSAYPTLTATINKIRKHWLNTERINEYRNTYLKSKNLYEKFNHSNYVIRAMQQLFNKQIELLEEAMRLVKMLENSDLYKRESPHLLNSIGSSKDAPDHVKNFTWYFNFLKYRPVLAIFVALVLIISWKFDWVYENSKHFINVKILHKEIDSSEKIKAEHIFNTGGQFLSLFHEMKFSKNTEPSISKIELKKHFSALNFNDNNLLNYNDTDLIERFNTYNTLRSKFEGYIDGEYTQYKPLYNAGINIILAISTKDKKYLLEFDKHWKKYQENIDYVVPEFDISNVQSENDVVVKSVEIFNKIKEWFGD